MNRRFVVRSATLLLLGASVLTACGSPSTTAQAAPETTAAAAPTLDLAVATAVAGRIESALDISGTLAPRSRVGIKPRLPGTLEKVLVDIGDAVKEGQTIATIDRREIDAQADAATAAIAVARAALETAEASLANAVTEHERAQNLFDKGALPRQRLDAAETAHRAATAQRELAKATLAQAEASARRAREVQRDATVTSPITGFVVERNYDAGATPGDLPVVVIADLRQLRLEAGVSELEAGRLRVGMKAQVSVQAKPGQVFDGVLAAIAPEVDERNRHFKIEVRVANDRQALLSGMYASARMIDASVADAILVPREAVTTQNGKRVALRVTGDTVTAVEVVEGLSDGRHVQIVKGLAAGDVVASDARRQIPAGARVRAVAAR
jgi:RND family efflux transporter MFP subunit